MEQHPIPQQISSYQFKLVGDMTLKQFFQVAGGVLVGLAFYSTPLHPLIKWPLIIFSGLLGVALAFLPFEERPLERWIIAFFRSIYSPTIYSWKKTDKPEVFFTEDAAAPEIKNMKISGPVVDATTAKFDTGETSFLSKVSSLWSTPAKSPVITTIPVAPVQTPPEPQVMPTSFTQSSNFKPDPVPTPVVTTPTVKNIPIPQQIPTVITKSAPKLVVEESTLHKNIDSNVNTQDLDMPALQDKPITSSEAEFSVDAAPPSPSIVINTIVGQIMDQDRKIIEGAIMEIKDTNGRPVRALKSNKAGHFIIVTPLANGKYEVTVEKDGFKFEPISFEAKGEIIPPIAIKGVKI